MGLTEVNIETILDSMLIINYHSLILFLNLHNRNQLQSLQPSLEFHE
jgi:hypothetical protein